MLYINIVKRGCIVYLMCYSSTGLLDKFLFHKRLIAMNGREKKTTFSRISASFTRSNGSSHGIYRQYYLSRYRQKYGERWDDIAFTAQQDFRPATVIYYLLTPKMYEKMTNVSFNLCFRYIYGNSKESI